MIVNPLALATKGYVANSLSIARAFNGDIDLSGSPIVRFPDVVGPVVLNSVSLRSRMVGQSVNARAKSETLEIMIMSYTISYHSETKSAEFSCESSTSVITMQSRTPERSIH